MDDRIEEQAGPVNSNASGEAEVSAQSTGPATRRLLRRTKSDRVIAGVCGGLGRYFNIDPVLFRIAFILLLLPGGVGLLIYIVTWLAMPEFKTEAEEEQDRINRPVNSRMAGTIVGGMLIAIGGLILLQQFIDWFDLRVIGAIVLIVIGAVVILRGVQSE